MSRCDHLAARRVDEDATRLHLRKEARVHHLLRRVGTLLRQRRFSEAAPETLAGYEVIRATAAPGNSFLRAARIDLAAIYDTLGQPERAERFRKELADTAQ